MKIFILAAGLGTRLGNFTKDIPKPMADINGKPFLKYVLESYKTRDFNDFILCVGYKSEVIKKYFGNGSKFGLNIKYSTSAKPLGTAGEIKNATKFIDDTFIVSNGDTFSDVNLMEAIMFHKKNNAIITIVCSKSNNEDRSGGVIIKNNIITAFDEKTERNLINSGVYICEPNITDILNNIDKENISFEYDIFPKLLKEKKIYGFVTDKTFIDIGIPKSLENFRNIINTK